MYYIMTNLDIFVDVIGVVSNIEPVQTFNTIYGPKTCFKFVLEDGR